MPVLGFQSDRCHLRKQPAGVQPAICMHAVPFLGKIGREPSFQTNKIVYGTDAAQLSRGVCTSRPPVIQQGIDGMRISRLRARNLILHPDFNAALSEKAEIVHYVTNGWPLLEPAHYICNKSCCDPWGPFIVGIPVVPKMLSPRVQGPLVLCWLRGAMFIESFISALFHLLISIHVQPA